MNQPQEGLSYEQRLAIIAQLSPAIQEEVRRLMKPEPIAPINLSVRLKGDEVRDFQALQSLLAPHGFTPSDILKEGIRALLKNLLEGGSPKK